MATVTASYNWVSGETVTPAKLNTTAAPTVVVADNEVTTAKILDANVTTAKIADANVTTAKIADANVTAAKLASNAVETAKIADDAVTNDKLSLAANAGEVKKALNADNSPPIYACRAWVSFNGSTVTNVGGENRCTISGSGNVSKVVRVSTGQYTVHFTTAMPSANYCAIASGRHAISTTYAAIIETNDFQSGTFNITAGYETASVPSTYNPTNINAAVFI
jgi:hypothetical protein